jgi:hypothetical protein
MYNIIIVYFIESQDIKTIRFLYIHYGFLMT